eukprot:TRINITY_DN1814_c0_g1_i2.p2 TRINITY_DN1814_c0_g1~~TRINITY_DN1814_c0_g1_i2.p2  ORF type:complete len:150 (-),score=12.22 TRINITY_DN1814_c0_g1_i2:634-1083(-)
MAATLQSRRVLKELDSWTRNPPAGLVILEGGPAQWVVQMKGAEGTVFQGEVFRLTVTFPPQYPLEAPDVVFQQPSPEMEHIYSNGHICLSILYDEWSPALTVESVCLSIQSMLSSARRKSRPPGDLEYCRRTQGKSPKLTHWAFHDDTV